MKVSISLPDELVRYIDDRVENRSRLIELLLQAWRKQQEQEAMVEACLLLDELSDELVDEDEAWQQAAITDWEASGNGRIYSPLVCGDGGCSYGGEFRGGVSTVGKFPSQGVDSESLAVVDVVSNLADGGRFTGNAGGVIRAVCRLGVSLEGG
ncbi:MAG: ribbon-helix-helix domain-containing protein [Microcoleus sp.]